MLHTKIFNTII